MVSVSHRDLQVLNRVETLDSASKFTYINKIIVFIVFNWQDLLRNLIGSRRAVEVVVVVCSRHPYSEEPKLKLRRSVWLKVHIRHNQYMQLKGQVCALQRKKILMLMKQSAISLAAAMH